jgi:cytochrome c oxidase assembly protein subunit 15
MPAPPAPADNPALRRFALLTAAATFLLVWMGGLVTSHEAGMSVPDWPNTYGYNMFFFPVSKWLGGIFFEHTHRLVASGVGLLTTILALWLFGRNSRPLLRWGGVLFLLAGIALCLIPQSAIRNPQSWKVPGGTPATAGPDGIGTLPNPQSAIRPDGSGQSAIPPASHLGDDLLLAAIGATSLAASFFWPKSEPSPKWLRWLGVAAFVAVAAQGVLGGLRVTLLKDQLGIFHATLAQLFFALMSVMALFQTKFWNHLPARAESDTQGLRYFFAAAALMILAQLALGATMRHQHAGLAIPDFPAAYHKIWPDTSPAAIVKYNQQRNEIQDYPPITAFQIVLQMVHRLTAGIIFVMAAICAWLARRQLGARHLLSRLASAWFWLIVAQIGLGAATIWTGKKADIATAHVACGALSLALGGLISMISFRCLAAPARENCPALKFVGESCMSSPGRLPSAPSGAKSM